MDWLASAEGRYLWFFYRVHAKAIKKKTNKINKQTKHKINKQTEAGGSGSWQKPSEHTCNGQMGFVIEFPGSD